MEIVYNDIYLGVGMDPFWRGLVERYTFPRRTPPAPFFQVSALPIPAGYGTMEVAF
jgi:hypothetical protein